MTVTAEMIGSQRIDGDEDEIGLRSRLIGATATIGTGAGSRDEGRKCDNDVRKPPPGEGS